MKKTNENSGEINLTIIAEGMEVRGELSSSDDIRIDGKFFGDIETKGRIVIAKEGYVEGNVSGKDILINGNAKGDFKAEKNFQLLSNGVFTGSVETRFINITETAVFDGTCVISQSKKPGLFKRQSSLNSKNANVFEEHVNLKSDKFPAKQNSKDQDKTKSDQEKDQSKTQETTSKEKEKGKSLISSKIRQIESL